MQTYPFSFTAQRGSTTIPAQGDLFVYESAENAGGELRIKVKPDNAGEITLRPGQRFRSHTRVTAWNITSYTGTEVVSGALIIGEGEFDDANTVNTFKLDGTFTNAVKVTNTQAERVPVQIDPSATINVAGATVAFTNSFSSVAVAAGVTTIVAPAGNANGMVVEMAEIVLAGPGANLVIQVALIAKATAPVTIGDGGAILLNLAFYSSSNGSDKVFLPARVKLPAGMGLYVVQESANGAAVSSKTVLYSIL